MSFLFNLPAVIQADLACEWLMLSDVVRLDSALCCKLFRADFLAIIASPQSIFTYHMFEHDESDARWVISRNAKFKAVHLFCDQITDKELSIELFLHLSCTALESVTLSTYLNNQYDSEDEQDITIGAELFIMVLISSCPNLTMFYVESTTMETNIRESLLINLMSRCNKLNNIVLMNCNCGSNALLRALYKAPNLERITLTGGSTPDRVQDIPLDLVNHKVSCFDCKEYTFSPGSDSNISQICTRFPNLVSLEATEVSNVDLLAISQHCPLLQDITICVSEVIEEEAALQAARNWPHLRKLALHRTNDPLPEFPDEDDIVADESCTEAALLCFIKHCLQLTYLNTVSRSSSYEEKSGRQTVGNCKTPCTTSQLYELYVDSLTIGGFRHVLALCKRLHILAIHHENPYLYDIETEILTERPLETALYGINKSTIKILYVHNYTNLTGDCLKRLTGLEQINFSNVGSRKLDSNDMLKLASRCPYLQKLSLYNCFPVLDNFVLKLLDSCPTLTSLDIQNARAENSYKRYTTSDRMLATLVRRVYPRMRYFHVDCQFFC